MTKCKFPHYLAPASTDFSCRRQIRYVRVKGNNTSSPGVNYLHTTLTEYQQKIGHSISSSFSDLASTKSCYSAIASLKVLSFSRPSLSPHPLWTSSCSSGVGTDRVCRSDYPLLIFTHYQQPICLPPYSSPTTALSSFFLLSILFPPPCMSSAHIIFYLMPPRLLALGFAFIIYFSVEDN